MLHWVTRYFTTSQTSRVFRARIKEVKTAFVTAEIEGAVKPNLVNAFMHPRGAGISIKSGTDIFLRDKPQPGSSLSQYEIIAVGFSDEMNQKVKFQKFACVHPDRPLSDPSKLCPNCPRRDNL